MRSNWFWGLVVPVCMVAAGVAAIVFDPRMGWLPILFLAGYFLLGLRVYRSHRRRGRDRAISRRAAAFGTIAKFPMGLGQWRARRARLFGTRQRLIEYKSAGDTARG